MFERNKFIPRTCTELYTYLVTTLLALYLHTTILPTTFSQHTNFKHLDNLQPEVMKQLLCHGKLAANGILNHEYIFRNVNCEQLGLLQPIEDLYPSMRRDEKDNSENFYSFLHLTMQEFFAAFFWSCTLPTPKLEVLMNESGMFPLEEFLSHFDAPGTYESLSNLTHWPVLLFLSGLIKPEIFLLQYLNSTGIKVIIVVLNYRTFSICAIYFLKSTARMSPLLFC